MTPTLQKLGSLTLLLNILVLMIQLILISSKTFNLAYQLLPINPTQDCPVPLLTKTLVSALPASTVTTFRTVSAWPTPRVHLDSTSTSANALQ